MTVRDYAMLMRSEGRAGFKSAAPGSRKGRMIAHCGAVLGAVLMTAAFLFGAGPPAEDPLVNRRKERRPSALKRFGGDGKTEQAVADGLAWLAAHQRADGVWDRLAFNRQCPANDRCSQPAVSRERKSGGVGVSALASLAFLGAGYTHEQGLHADTLTRAFEFILARQDLSGSFSAGSGLQMYNDAIATLAIAEAFALTRDPVFKEPLRRAVRHLERAQQSGGGWDYRADSQTDRNDTSITGWVLMALKSAQAAGVPPSVETRFRLSGHFDRATEPSGRVWYANSGTGTSADPSSGFSQRRYGPAMTAIGLYARGGLGFRLDDGPARRQVNLLLGDLPSLPRLYGQDASGLHNEYYWYYGTLALFNVGGEAWQRWNQALRSSILEYQERPIRKNGTKRHAYGSWPAFGRDWGKWGRTGSRIYSTAINTLTLEVYYRYVPAYLSPRGLIGPTEVRRRLAALGPRGAGELLAISLRLHPDSGEPLLLDFLASNDRDVRLEAAVGLGHLGSPHGRDELRRRRKTAGIEKARRIDAALAAIREPEPEITYGKITRVNAGARMFLFDTNGRRLYYGQPVAVLREGRPVAAARVNRRYSPQQAAAAKLAEDEAEVRVGDTVRAAETSKRQNAETSKG